MTKFDADDHHHMVRALELARLGMYSTPPNPSVGCVLVRWGQVVGEGHHQRAGARRKEPRPVRAVVGSGVVAHGR